MKNIDKKTFMQAAMASTIGFQVAFSPFIGLGIGFFLDLWLGTGHILTVVFLVLGVVAGARNYYRFAKEQQEQEKGQKKE